MKRLLVLLFLSVCLFATFSSSFAYDVFGNFCGRTYSQQRISGGVNCVANGTNSLVMTTSINTTNTNYHVYAKIGTYNKVTGITTEEATVREYGKQGKASLASASREYNNGNLRYSHIAFLSTSMSPSDASIVASEVINVYQYSH